MAQWSSQMGACCCCHLALHFFNGPGYSGHKNLVCSCLQQYPGALARGGAGGHNVIHNQDVAPADLISVATAKSPPRFYRRLSRVNSVCGSVSRILISPAAATCTP